LLSISLSLSFPLLSSYLQGTSREVTILLAAHLIHFAVSTKIQKIVFKKIEGKKLKRKNEKMKNKKTKNAKNEK
jgi:hypothetical protein